MKKQFLICKCLRSQASPGLEGGRWASEARRADLRARRGVGAPSTASFADRQERADSRGNPGYRQVEQAPVMSTAVCNAAPGSTL